MTDGLGKTGKAVWDAFGAGRLDSASQALVRELARCADVLDRLDGLASGRREAWVSLVFDEMGEIHLTVDKLLDEQRKTQVVFKQLYAELRTAGIKPQVRTNPGGKDEEAEEVVDVLAVLRKKKEERERQSG